MFRARKKQENEMNETAYGNNHELMAELTADIVAAYVSNHVVPVSELSDLIADVHAALSNTSSPAPVAAIVEKQKPAVSVRKSLQDEQLTCLECGNTFKSLKRYHWIIGGQIPLFAVFIWRQCVVCHQVALQRLEGTAEFETDEMIVLQGFAHRHRRLWLFGDGNHRDWRRGVAQGRMNICDQVAQLTDRNHVIADIGGNYIGSQFDQEMLVGTLGRLRHYLFSNFITGVIRRFPDDTRFQYTETVLKTNAGMPYI
eukprot:gene16138-21387_t